MVRILLIEDEKPVRELTKVKLRDKYEILEAEDGLKAFDVLEHEKTDLIIVDVMMPNIACGQNRQGRTSRSGPTAATSLCSAG